jgi:hypothetical protein
VELIVVIAIVAIISAVLVPLLGGYFVEEKRAANKYSARNAGVQASAALAAAAKEGGIDRSLPLNTGIKGTTPFVRLKSGESYVSLASLSNNPKGTLGLVVGTTLDVITYTESYWIAVWYTDEAATSAAELRDGSGLVGFYTNGPATWSDITTFA